MWSAIKDVLKESWYAPLFWPLFILFAVAEEGPDIHWSVFVLAMPFVLLFVVFGFAIMLPVQMLVFAVLLIAAPFALIYNLFTKETRP